MNDTADRVVDSANTFHGTDLDLSLVQQDKRFAVPRDIDIKDGAANTHGRRRCLDGVSLAVLLASDKAERPRNEIQSNRGDAVLRLTKHELVKFEFGIGAERKLCIVIKLELRTAFAAGLQDFVAMNARAFAKAPLYVAMEACQAPLHRDGCADFRSCSNIFSNCSMLVGKCTAEHDQNEGSSAQWELQSVSQAKQHG